VVDAREKYPSDILCQSSFWLDDYRLDRGTDVGDVRTQRGSDKFGLLGRAATQEKSGSFGRNPIIIARRSRAAQSFDIPHQERYKQATSKG